ncbi:MAG: hypothetical protein HOH48_00275 [Candidatus Puniceispirillum sp.]|jgi:hypothetical protein|uniref:hypothetical protein n=1 Tax=Candidatus Puniceispirillum sp. TaxID=2026719 RepID=UPI001ECDB182|nr:hypothetical protein [Candidatus Puniceispirillum sp.]MBT6416386.1 hypothetical protein [Candidatus Puniceispirillum sp.]MBT6567058.1 hypothetical protein [Candidatus Puniceispirillum sp.]
MTPCIWKTVLNKVVVIALSLLLAACHLAQPQVTSTPLKKPGSQTTDTVSQDVEATPAPLPSLEFEWDTGYSSVILPPDEVRKAAIESCKARGFARGYMISVALNEGKVRALYGCRGPN